MACECFDFKDEDLLIKNYRYWTLYLAECQFLIGWCHGIVNRHIQHFEELHNNELAEFKEVVRDWKKMLNRTFEPNWFNIMQLGNMTPHLHFQMVPRYKNPRYFLSRKFEDEKWGRIIQDKWVVEDKDFLMKLKEHLNSHI